MNLDNQNVKNDKTNSFHNTIFSKSSPVLMNNEE